MAGEMIFKTKCKWCGQGFEVVGFKAISTMMDEHRKTCVEPKKKSRSLAKSKRG